VTRSLIFSMQMSLDGYIAGPKGELDWHRVDEELHRHFNEQERRTDVALYGRRLYELMAAYWPSADEDATEPAFQREYAEIWRALPKVVFSRTLERVEWNARLVRDDAAAEVARLKEEGDGVLSVGGATLASSLIGAGLVDECWVYVTPAIVGGGTPMFAPGLPRSDWRLVETQPFGSGVTLLRYQRASDA
jgi:dihydrofolate reductase